MSENTILLTQHSILRYSVVSSNSQRQQKIIKIKMGRHYILDSGRFLSLNSVLFVCLFIRLFVCILNDWRSVAKLPVCPQHNFHQTVLLQRIATRKKVKMYTSISQRCSGLVLIIWLQKLFNCYLAMISKWHGRGTATEGLSFPMVKAPIFVVDAASSGQLGFCEDAIGRFWAWSGSGPG